MIFLVEGKEGSTRKMACLVFIHRYWPICVIFLGLILSLSFTHRPWQPFPQSVHAARPLE